MSSNDLEGEDIWGDASGESKQADNEETKEDSPNEEQLDDDDTRHMSISELRQRIHLLNNDIRVMKSDVQRITHESRGQRDRIRENQEKVKLNKQLPYLVANVVEILEPDAEDGKKIFVLPTREASIISKESSGSASLTASNPAIRVLISAFLFLLLRPRRGGH